jgi:FdhE protein
MSTTATIRVMSAEEISARAGGSTPFLQFPERGTLFAERAMRLKQRAAGHAMGDYLGFVGALAMAQHQALAVAPALALPSAEQLDAAARAGLPPLPASEWPRDRAWHGVLRDIATALRADAPAGVQPTLAALLAADEEWLERQADCLLTGVMNGLDLAAAPIVAGALQVCWTHLLLETRDRRGDAGAPFGPVDDGLGCPCCGSRPVAGIALAGAEFNGQRYLHCSLCSLRWHLLRGQCSHCGSRRELFYESLAPAGAGEDESMRAAKSALQAEICEDCGHYLKLMHAERDPFVEPVADDLASLTLDLLVSEAGRTRHGVNFMLLFGEPERPPPDPEGE